MSALNRIASGSSASLFGLLANIVAQIALVPVFLSHWDQTTFGVWAGLQGFIAIMQLVDSGHQDFVGFECLRMPIEDRGWRSRVLSSALPFSLLTGSTPLLVVGAMWASGSLGLLFDGGGPSAAAVVAQAAAIYALSYLFAQCFSGLFGRVLASVGEAPRMQWLTVFQYLFASLVQVVAVVAGYGILGVATVQAVATVLLNLAIDYHYLGRLRRLDVVVGRPDWRLGGRNVVHSLALTLGAAVETLQLTGFRVVLVPLIGPAPLAKFTTLRTVANTAQQGINTFVYPAVPELMRVASARNASGTAAILGLLWLLSVMIIAPGIVLLQFLAPVVYHSWTRGKIAWDGPTFALLSIAILINGFGQPARAIMRGNNLLRLQLFVSVAAGVVLLGGAWLLVPQMGLAGAGVALVVAEAVRSGLNLLWSGRWLRQASLALPGRTLGIAALVTVGCSVVLIAMAERPHDALALAGVFLLGWLVCVAGFWMALPQQVRQRLAPLLRWLGVRRGLAAPVAREFDQPENRPAGDMDEALHASA